MPDSSSFGRYETLELSLDEGILNVWLNRPQVRNALSDQMEAEWDALLDAAEELETVSVVTLRGRGPVFSAGHDLHEVAEAYLSEGGSKPAWKQQNRPLPRSWYFRKTLIAAVHGYVGPAAQRLLAPFDFILAAEGTRFSYEQARMGSPDPGGNLMVFQLPMRVIKQLWLMGGWFDAEAAKDMYLVQRVVHPSLLDDELQKWAMSAAGVATDKVAMYKESIHRMYEIMGLLGIVGIGNKRSEQVSEAELEFFKVVRDQGIKEALHGRQQAVDPEVTRILPRSWRPSGDGGAR